MPLLLPAGAGTDVEPLLPVESLPPCAQELHSVGEYGEMCTHINRQVGWKEKKEEAYPMSCIVIITPGLWVKCYIVHPCIPPSPPYHGPSCQHRPHFPLFINSPCDCPTQCSCHKYPWAQVNGPNPTVIPRETWSCLPVLLPKLKMIFVGKKGEGGSPWLDLT